MSKSLSFLFRSTSYADFFLVPIYIVVLFYYDNLPVLWMMLSVFAGIVIWSLIEYWMHRALLHGTRLFRADHVYHHAHPTESIGNPPWSTLFIAVGLWSSIWFCTNIGLASSLTIGIMIGYIIYAIVHVRLHHDVTNRWFIMRYLHEHHDGHHKFARTNYGIITTVWDHLFRTKR